MANKTVRVLVDQVIGGQDFKSGALVKADAEILKPYLKESTVDDSKTGVEYALEQGEKVQVIEKQVDESNDSDSESAPDDQDSEK